MSPFRKFRRCLVCIVLVQQVVKVKEVRSETVGLCDRYRTIDNTVMAAMRCSNFSRNPDLHLGFEDESEGQKKDIVAKVSSSTSSGQ
ncbi:hypothetical protein J6590_090103 [Homalodisca vitripennis]|nr:hypothetical protein J6590_090103 [Homalodisca vitripennis]